VKNCSATAKWVGGDVGTAHVLRSKGCQSAVCRLAFRVAWVSSGPRAFFKCLPPVPGTYLVLPYANLFLKRLAPIVGFARLCVRLRLQASLKSRLPELKG
jgi:hypothetical protein